MNVESPMSVVAVLKLHCRNGDTLYDLEDQMIHATAELKQHKAALEAEENRLRYLRELVAAAEALVSNLETRMHVWHGEHGEKLRRRTEFQNEHHH